MSEFVVRDAGLGHVGRHARQDGLVQQEWNDAHEGDAVVIREERLIAAHDHDIDIITTHKKV